MDQFEQFYKSMNTTHPVNATTFGPTIVVWPMFKAKPALNVTLLTLRPITRSSIYVLESKNLHRLSADQGLLGGGN